MGLHSYCKLPPTSQALCWEWCSLIVILNKRSLRSEEPVPSEVEGIRASRAMCRVLCDTIIARLARFLIPLAQPHPPLLNSPE